MLCLGSQSQPVLGPMGHIIGARIGPKRHPLLLPLLSAQIPPPQIIWTLYWPGTCRSKSICSNLFILDGHFFSTSPIIRGSKFKRRILKKQKQNRSLEKYHQMYNREERAVTHTDIPGLTFLSENHNQHFLWNPANNLTVKCENLLCGGHGNNGPDGDGDFADNCQV